MDAIKKILYELKDKSLNFIGIHRQKILVLSIVLIGLFSLRIVYDYQQERKDMIYKTVDESTYFECINKDEGIGKRILFGLNRSPQDREIESYSRSTVIYFNESVEGLSEPTLRKVKTYQRTDFLDIWVNEIRFPYSLYDRKMKERPSEKLNRITGNLHSLKAGKTLSCGLSSHCRNYFKESDYRILTCEEISEKKFYATFNNLVKDYEGERKF